MAAAPSAEAADESVNHRPEGDEIENDEPAQPEGVREHANVEVLDWDAEGEDLKVAHDPKLPTDAEVEAHRAAGHWPFRSWCIHCMASRGLGMPHRTPSSGSRGREIPVISIDYFFLTGDGCRVPGEEGASQLDLEQGVEDGTIVKCLALRDSMHKSVFAWVIPAKGRNEFTVSRIVEAVRWLGFSRIILKSDNEPSIRALVKDALAAVRVECDIDEAKPEHSTPYDSQSNGGIENAIRNLRRQMRSIRSCLEERISAKIEPTSALIQWMLPHAAWVMKAMIKGNDGKTAWQRTRGRPFAKELLGFGETCLYKLPMKGPQAQRRGNIENTMAKGIVLGFQGDTSEYILATDHGIVRSRSINRLPFASRWVPETLAGIKSTPQNQFTAPDAEARFPSAPDVLRQESSQAPSMKVRRLKITDGILRKYGYTHGCTQCEHITRHGGARPGLQHDDKCRQRIMDDMAKDPWGQQRLAELEQRVDRALADFVQDSHEARPADIPEQPHGDLLPESLHQDLDAARPPQRSVHAPDDAERQFIDSHSGVRGGLALPADEASPAETPSAAGSHHGGQDDPMEMDFGGGDTPLGDDAMDDTGDLADDEILCFVRQLGACPKAYLREQRQGLRALVSEIYSPPRVTAMAHAMPSLRLVPGFALI